jgi:Tol biopolymer transport system component
MIGLALLAGGCAAGYRNVALHEVETVQTEEGRALGVSKKGYLAIEEVIERSPNVKSVTRMTDLKGDREPSFFAVSPDGQSLVFQCYEVKGDVGHINLWKMSTGGGTAMTRLTAGRYFDMEPAFDSSGDNVYFASNRSSVLPKLWRVQADGAGGITRITQADSEDRHPSVEPGDKRLYYASRPFNASIWQIWRVGANGALPTQMKEGKWPEVSPDGKKLVYSAWDSKTRRWKIWLMDADGTGQTQLTFDTESNDWHPTWSPDGRRILFASNAGKDSNGQRNFDIWMMNVDGSGLTQLTTNGSTDFMPRCSPDGGQIYFVSNRGFYWDIWRMEIVQP